MRIFLRRTANYVVGVLIVMVAVPRSAHASHATFRDTLRLSDALALARSANPTVRAARLRADVAVQRIPQARAWENPQIAFGLMNRPVSGFGAGEPMTMNVFEVMQSIPWPGKLRYGGAQATLEAVADSLDAEETLAQLDAQVQDLYFELAFIDRAVVVLRETRSLLRNFLDVSSTRYAVGEGLQQDVLQAQVAVARMAEDITVMEQDRIAAAARLNALLGRGATVEVPALELPSRTFDLPSVDSLMTLAARARPSLQAAQARIEAADAGYRAARRMLYPDINLRASYNQRPQFDDMVSLMVGVSVPLFAGNRQLPLREESLAIMALEEARHLEVYNETFARVTELRAQAERARTLSSLYTNSVLPQARASVESAFSAYRVGRVDYGTLVENEMVVNRYAIESIRLRADFHRAVAELAALTGSTPGESS